MAEVDTGVVSHGPGGGKSRLISDTAAPGRVPYVDARDLAAGRTRWLNYQPALMHRPKRPELFTSPKVLVQRLRGHTNNDAIALDAVRGCIACGGRMNELRVWQMAI